MRLLLVIKTQLIGAMVIGEPGSDGREDLLARGVRRQVYYLQHRRLLRAGTPILMTEDRAHLTGPWGCDPLPTSARRWGDESDSAEPLLPAQVFYRHVRTLPQQQKPE